MSRIRAVVIPPFGSAYSTFIPGGLSSMQAVVGGNIEHIVPTDSSGNELGRADSPTRSIDFWCNEEYLYTPELPFCRAVMLGKMLVPVFGAMLVTSADSWGETVSMSRDEALSVLEVAEIRCPQFAHPTYLEPDGSAIVETIVDAIPEWLERNVKRNELTIKYNRAEMLGSLPLPLVGEPELTMAGDFVVRFTDNPMACIIETRGGEVLGELSHDEGASWNARGTLGPALDEAEARVAEHVCAAAATRVVNESLDEQSHAAREDAPRESAPHHEEERLR